MSIDITIIILLIFAGFTSGLFIGICSGTAAAIMIPFLTVFLGNSIFKSIGTSLSIDSLVGLTAGLMFFKNKKVKLKSTAPIIISAVIGAVTGSFFTSKSSETGLNIYIGVVLLIFGINLMYNGVQKNVDYVKSKYSFDFFKKHKMLVFIIGGFLIGLMSGFTGFGGAAFVAIGLVFILDYNLHSAIGTSLLMMFFIAGAGAIVHIARDEFILSQASFAIPAAVVGAMFGSLFANKINEDILGRIIGFLMLFLGIAVFARMYINI